jgi:hypothetical protein
MPGGLSVRQYKKQYKKALVRLAAKIPAAFADKRDYKRWISEVTNGRMKELKHDKG